MCLDYEPKNVVGYLKAVMKWPGKPLSGSNFWGKMEMLVWEEFILVVSMSI